MRAQLAAAVDEVLKSNRVVLTAEAVGRTPNALYKWTRVPADLVLQVEAFTKIPRQRLRPDIYGTHRIRPEPRKEGRRLRSRAELVPRRAVL